MTTYTREKIRFIFIFYCLLVCLFLFFCLFVSILSVFVCPSLFLDLCLSLSVCLSLSLSVCLSLSLFAFNIAKDFHKEEDTKLQVKEV